jgi:exopolyphosphatase/guanosine-5'-triphosphate,3'-diphosphate pyrophosphatase
MLNAIEMDLRRIAHWVARHLEGIEHEQRVVRIASALFDLTPELHGLGPRGRNLLRAAALVHDVGRCVDKANHPIEGARLILRDRSLDLTRAQRRALAFLTLYHRDAVPPVGREALLRDGDDRTSMRKILALLRTADALDSRSQESPRLTFAFKRGQLRVTCYLSEMSGKARKVYARRKKHRLLEEELGCGVEVDVRAAARVRQVA